MKTLKIYSAEWCGPCKQLKAILPSVDLGDVNLLQIDVEAWKDEAKADNVRSVPTLIVIEDGVEIKRKTGAMSKDQLLEFVS